VQTQEPSQVVRDENRRDGCDVSVAAMEMKRGWCDRRPALFPYLFGFLGVLELALIITPSKTDAVMYRCIDAFGRNIFTDSLSQLDQCSIVEQNPSTPIPLSSVLAPDRVTEPLIPDANQGGVNPVQPGMGSTVQSAHVTVPVTKIGRSLVVQVRVNGSRDARLIVDTGADITVLSREVARDVGLMPDVRTPSVMLNTVGGPVQSDAVLVDRMEIGAAEVRNVSAAVSDLPDAPVGVDGLLGLTFLDKFLLTLDVEKGELSLRRRE
jgi:clan AA aspartic protease (TIGR02281 family)